MDYFKKQEKNKYKLVMFESDLPNAYSGKVDAEIEDDNTVCLSVYNNPILYRRLQKTIEKYF